MSLAAAYASFAFGCDFEHVGESGDLEFETCNGKRDRRWPAAGSGSRTDGPLELPALQPTPRLRHTETGIMGPVRGRRPLIERPVRVFSEPTEHPNVARHRCPATSTTSTTSTASTTSTTNTTSTTEELHGLADAVLERCVLAATTGDRSDHAASADVHLAMIKSVPANARNCDTSLPAIIQSRIRQHSFRSGRRFAALRQKGRNSVTPVSLSGRGQPSPSNDTDAASEASSIIGLSGRFSDALPELMHLREHQGARDANGVYAGVWRTGEVEQELQIIDEESAAMALNRLESTKEIRRKNRKQAHRYREAAERNVALTELRWLLDHAAELNLGLNLQSKGPVGLQLPPSPRRKTLAMFSSVESALADRASDSDDSTCKDPCPTNVNVRSPHGKSTLQKMNIKLKSTVAERQRNINNRRQEKLLQQIVDRELAEACETSDDSKRNICDRVQSILEKDRNDGNGRVLDDALLKEVFQIHDVDKSQTLDQAEIMACLRDLGMGGRTETERVEIRNIALRSVEDLTITFKHFKRTVVRSVRSKLAELRLQSLQSSFKEMDHTGDGLICIEDFSRIIRRNGDHPSKGCIYKAIKETSAEVAKNGISLDGNWLMLKPLFDMDTFLKLASTIASRAHAERVVQSHRIVDEYKISHEDNMLWGDSLLDLYEAFENAMDDHLETVKRTKFKLLVRAVGQMPTDPGLQALLDKLVVNEIAEDRKQDLRSDEPVLKNDGISFRGFLSILQKLLTRKCQGVFDTFGKDEELDMHACLRALADCGIKTSGDDSLTALIEEFDVDGSGTIDRAEFLPLVRFVQDRQHMGRIERVRAEVVARSLTDAEFKSLRDAFWELDPGMKSVISLAHASDVLARFRGSKLDGDWNLILENLCIVPDSGDRPLTRSGNKEVDFFTLIRMMQESKFLMTCRGFASDNGMDEEAFFHSRKLFRSMKPDSEGEIERSWLQHVLTERITQQWLQEDSAKTVQKFQKLQQAMDQEVPRGLPVDLHNLLRLLARLDDEVVNRLLLDL